MKTIEAAIDAVVRAQKQSEKPLAVILAGHNGSGKSTLWHNRLARVLQIPLVNADRMMLSILPEPDTQKPLPPWAQHIRDSDESWMKVAQKGVESFVAWAAAAHVAFATETVFSHWKKRADGSYESKMDKIIELQKNGYFVMLLFVGLSSAALSMGACRPELKAVDTMCLLKSLPKDFHALKRPFV